MSQIKTIDLIYILGGGAQVLKNTKSMTVDIELPIEKTLFVCYQQCLLN